MRWIARKVPAFSNSMQYCVEGGGGVCSPSQISTALASSQERIFGTIGQKNTTYRSHPLPSAFLFHISEKCETRAGKLDVSKQPSKAGRQGGGFIISIQDFAPCYYSLSLITLSFGLYFLRYGMVVLVLPCSYSQRFMKRPSLGLPCVHFKKANLACLGFV